MRGVLLLTLLSRLLIPSESAKRVRHEIKITEIITKNLSKKEETASILSKEVHVWTKELYYDNQDDLYRVRASVDQEGDSVHPFIQFSISNGRESVAFHLPERISDGTLVYETSRFIHPLFPTKNRQEDVQHSLIITVQTIQVKPLEYSLGVQALSEGQYVIRLNKTGQWGLVNQRVGVGRPEAYLWDTSGVNTAKISIKSEDSLCGILYLNNREESIYYSNGEMNTEPRSGFRALTFSGRLDLNLDRESLKEQLFLYVLLQPEDSLCDPHSAPRNLNQNKIFTIRVEIVDEVGVFLPWAFFLGLFLAPPVLLFFYVIRQLPKRELQQLTPEPPLIVFESSSLQQNDCFEMEHLVNESPRIIAPERGESSPFETSPEAQIVIKDVGAWSWSAGDLQFAFFMAPGLLLAAFQYVQSLSFNRLEDSCYHNYGCAVPWGRLVAFNHLVSNVGYLFNGLYFIAFAAVRHRHHYVERGSYNNFGLELSLGIALICQGLASTIYHVCPSSVSFTFDTPFMQAMCVLIILKLYGNRHGSSPPSLANGTVAAVMAANTFLTFSEHTVMARLASGVAQAVLVMFSIKKIFNGNSMIHGVSSANSVKRGFKIVGTVTIAVNFFIAIGYNMGMYKSHQFVTIFCITNMVIYLIYYYSMKIYSREKQNWLSTTSGVTALVLWTLAAVFFFHEETNWKLTAAQSRNLNSECFLFSYYDRHDVWHLLSAEAAFSSLIALSTLDDVQATLPRAELCVF